MDIEAGLRRPKIDVHTHVFRMENRADEAASADQLVKAGEMLGITEFWTFSPIITGFGSIEEVREENDTVLRAMRRHPDRIRGMCFVIPGHFKAALDEIDRCLDEGMIGIKLYNQYRLSDPVQWPVIERAIERRVPILMHAGFLPAREDLDGQPNISHGSDFRIASDRYPEAMLIHAHVGGGGDWERTIREMRGCSVNMFADVSGSNLDDGQVEFSVRELGAERVLFGTDGTMAGGVGKVLDATISDEERELIFRGNAERILDRQGKRSLAPGNKGDA